MVAQQRYFVSGLYIVCAVNYGNVWVYTLDSI